MFDAEAIKEFVKAVQAHQAPLDLQNGETGILVPEGFSLTRIPPLEKILPRISQIILMHDKLSFVAYVNEYKSAQSKVFAEPGFVRSGQSQVTAVLDYHSKDAAEYGVHVVVYSPRYSDQWVAWQNACKTVMKQAEFAEFIEEVRADIHTPEAAQLIDIVQEFKAAKRTDFDSLVRQPGGNVRLNYSETVEQKGSSGLLPEKMTLGIPVYFRGTTYSVPLFVRFKVSGGAVTFALKLDRADIIEDAAFNEIVATIAQETNLPVYLGRRS